MLVDGAWCEALRLHVVGAGGGGGFASLRLACRPGSEGGVSDEAGGLMTRSGVYPWDGDVAAGSRVCASTHLDPVGFRVSARRVARGLSPYPSHMCDSDPHWA